MFFLHRFKFELLLDIFKNHSFLLIIISCLNQSLLFLILANLFHLKLIFKQFLFFYFNFLLFTCFKLHLTLNLLKIFFFLLIIVFSLKQDVHFLFLTVFFVLETVLKHFQFVFLILLLFTSLELQLILYFIEFTSFLLRFTSSLIQSFTVNLKYACYFLLFYSLIHLISFLFQNPFFIV